MNFLKSVTQPSLASKPKYEPPRIITYTDDQLLELLGPAQAGNSLNSNDDDILQKLIDGDENPWGDK